MNFELNNVVKMILIFNKAETEIKNFLFLSASALKNKEYKIKSAENTLSAIENYKNLPVELRKELEKDKTGNINKIIEIEKLCKEVISKK